MIANQFASGLRGHQDQTAVLRANFAPNAFAGLIGRSIRKRTWRLPSPLMLEGELRDNRDELTQHTRAFYRQSDRGERSGPTIRGIPAKRSLKPSPPDRVPKVMGEGSGSGTMPKAQKQELST